MGQILSRVQTLLKDMDCDTTKIVKPLGDSLVPVFGRSGLPIFSHLPWEFLPTTHSHCIFMKLLFSPVPSVMGAPK